MPGNNDHLPPDEVLVPILRQVGAGDLAAVLATCRAFYRLRAEYLLPVLHGLFAREARYTAPPDYWSVVADSCPAGVLLNKACDSGDFLAAEAVARAAIEVLSVTAHRRAWQLQSEMAWAALRAVMASPAPAPASFCFFYTNAKPYRGTLRDALRVRAIIHGAVMSFIGNGRPDEKKIAFFQAAGRVLLRMNTDALIANSSRRPARVFAYNPLHLAAGAVEDGAALLTALDGMGFDPEGRDPNKLTPADHAEAAGHGRNVATLAALAAADPLKGWGDEQLMRSATTAEAIAEVYGLGR